MGLQDGFATKPYVHCVKQYGVVGSSLRVLVSLQSLHCIVPQYIVQQDDAFVTSHVHFQPCCANLRGAAVLQVTVACCIDFTNLQISKPALFITGPESDL